MHPSPAWLPFPLVIAYAVLRATVHGTHYLPPECQPKLGTKPAIFHAPRIRLPSYAAFSVVLPLLCLVTHLLLP